MTNHVHLLLRPGPAGVSLLLQRLLGPYTQWFNRRHGCVGHVFQGRFGSRTIESTDDFLTVLRYVHRNPVEAGLVARAEEWRWSTQREYLRRVPPAFLRDSARFALSLFADDPLRAVEDYRRFVDLPGEELRAPFPAEGGDAPLARTGPDIESAGADNPRRDLLEVIARRWEERVSLEPGTIRGPRRTRPVAAARRAFCLEAVDGQGYSHREVSDFLGRSEANTSVLLRDFQGPECKGWNLARRSATPHGGKIRIRRCLTPPLFAYLRIRALEGGYAMANGRPMRAPRSTGPMTRPSWLLPVLSPIMRICPSGIRRGHGGVPARR
jgi:hypothetical protein